MQEGAVIGGIYVYGSLGKNGILRVALTRSCPRVKAFFQVSSFHLGFHAMTGPSTHVALRVAPSAVCL